MALTRDPDDEGAIRKLIAAAERLGPDNPLIAYAAQLQALTAAYDLQRPELMQAITTSLATSPASDSGAIVELIIAACQRMLADGRQDPMAAYDLFRQAAIALRDKPQLEEFDLRAILRSGTPDDELDDRIADEIVRAVGTKWAGHRIGQVDFVRPDRSMSQIGG